MTSSSSPELPVVIVGAGLAGLCLAQSLVRRGHDVQLFERDEAHRPRRQGYRITLDRHGMAALKYCLPPGLFDLVMATKGVPGGWFRFTDWKLRDIFALSFDTKPEDGGQVDRQTLHKILGIGLEDRIHFGKTAVAVEDSPEGAAVRFSDGMVQMGAIVIAADGAGSVLRSQIVSGASPEPSPFVGIYGASPLRQDSHSLVPDGLAKSGVLALGDEQGHGFFFTAMRFPEPPATAFARFAPHRQPPVIEDYVMWALVFPEGEHHTELTQGDPKNLQRVAVDLAKPFHPVLRRMVETSNPEYTRLSGFSAASQPTSWDRKRATLMGDAVHVMPPFGAHGGNTALRDAALLAEMLEDASESGLALESALTLYQRQMEDYAFKAVATANRSMGRLKMNPIMRWILLKLVVRFHRVTVPLPEP